MTRELFVLELNNMHINVTDRQLEQLDLYYKLLVKYNKMFNITTIIDEQSVYLKHFYDCICVCKAIDLNNVGTMCDFGTGGGFPGLVLKIMFPAIEMTLIDSNAKKTSFLTKLVSDLGLDHIIIKTMRVENIPHTYYEKFDVVIARAVAKTDILLELCCQLVRINGFFVATKGHYDDEIIAAKGKASLLGFKLDSITEYCLPQENSSRSLLLFKKIQKTDQKYPRDFSKIKRND